MKKPKKNLSTNQTKKERTNKRAKLQSMGHNLKNKVNNLLNEIEVNEKIDSMMLYQQINPNPNNVDLPIIIPKINPNLEKENLEKQKIEPNSTLSIKENAKNKNNNGNSLNLQNIENNLRTVKKNIKKLQKGSFMTGVGLTKTKKEPISINQKQKEKDEMMNNINTQINAILKNIDDEEEPKKVYKDIKNLKNSADFKNIIEEIDSYTNEIHEEFDEIKYLIKFADNTHKLIDRHKNVMTNIFRGAGLRPSNRIEEEEKLKNEKGKIKKYKSTGKFKKIDDLSNFDYKEDDENDDQPYYKNGYYYRNAKEDDMNFGEVFDKLKAINKVKDNLSNIQDDFLGYHQNLRTKMRRINGGK
jgi:hypothetical protein